MAMGKRIRVRQPAMWITTTELPTGEGIDSERGIAWRAADSLALRDFLAVGLEDAPPDHSTISRTRRLIDLETQVSLGNRALSNKRMQADGPRVGK